MTTPIDTTSTSHEAPQPPAPPSAPKVPEEPPKQSKAPTVPRSAGWTRGVSRKSSLYVLDEFKNATKALAAQLNISSGVLAERALIAYFEAQSNGIGAQALAAVRDVRHHCEEDRGNG